MIPAESSVVVERQVRAKVPGQLPMWSFALIVVAIAIGATLRLYQFTADTSLWLDELALANNLADRSLWSLLREPLGYAQVAPPGFVVFEKLVYEVFGANDHALRTYSLIAGLGSLGLMALVAVRLGLRQAAWVAPMLLALSPSLVFQSVQLKPYAGDVFFALAIVFLALGLRNGNTKPVGAAALGAIAPWFSFPAVFVLAAAGGVLLLSQRRRALFPVVVVWGTSAVLALLYSFALLSDETAFTMDMFWRRNGLGYPPSVLSAIPWLLRRLKDQLWSDLALRGVTLWLGIVAIGAFALWRRNRGAVALLTLPIALAGIAALLHRYPLGNRVSIWIATLLMLLIAVAAETGAALLRRMRLSALAAVPALAVVVLPAITVSRRPPPYRVDHVKPVFAQIAAERRPNDWLFVYPGAWHAYRYYGGLTGIPRERAVVGRCPQKTERESLLPIDAFRGDARVWVLFAHVSRPKDRRVLLEYLDHVGTRRMSVTYPTPYVAHSSSVDAHLYDLSDVEKLRRASSLTFPIALGDVPNEHLTCLFGMVPREVTARPPITSTGEVVRD